MKLKVGDKVKLVRMDDESEVYKKYLGNTYTIDSIGELKSGEYANLKEIVSISPYLKNLELVKDKYTYEDLKKAPIGTKVTFENGEVFVKDDKETYENRDKGRDEIDFVKMEDRFGTLGKIIKIEEPVYNTVYEDKQNILTETEKNYLKIVIGPVKDKVLNITKTQQRTYTARKFIDIEIQDDDCICLSFIDENSELSYKGMKTEHPYTLQELGL